MRVIEVLRSRNSAIERSELDAGFQMSLSDFAALGSFISGLAILIRLNFLHFQLRQLGGVESAVAID